MRSSLWDRGTHPAPNSGPLCLNSKFPFETLTRPSKLRVTLVRRRTLLSSLNHNGSPPEGTSNEFSKTKFAGKSIIHLHHTLHHTFYHTYISWRVRVRLSRIVKERVR